MGCLGNREKGDVEEQQKWDYVTLSDFKSTSAWTPISYVWLWILAIIAVAVYAADTFTAVNLLAYDKWSSKIEPAIPFKYSKWIFAVCIFISWALAGWEWLRAVRVIKRGGVAESYMDPLAVTLQSMRPQGWKRFLVFAQLTKSKKGADYVALFVYFAFKGAIRVILAEGPRQVVNALTLYSVMKADLVPTGSHAATDNTSSVVQFFKNIQTLADSNPEQAVVLFTMLFTLVIWVISALSLLTALVLYLVFLWHYVPQSDGRLSIYCKRKIDRRLERIVDNTVKKALEESEKKRQKELARAAKKGDLPAKPGSQPVRQPTLPLLGSPNLEDDKKSAFGLVRQDTETTLPPYTSRPPASNENHGMQRQPTLPDVSIPSQRPGMPSRFGTKASDYSNGSYSSDAPLLDNATDMGYTETRTQTPAQRMPPFDRQASNGSYASRPPPGRSLTGNSQGSQRPYPPITRPGTAQSGIGMGMGPRLPVRSNTAFSYEQGRGSPAPSGVSPISREDNQARAYGPPMRSNTQDTFGERDDGYMGPPMRQNTQDSFGRPMGPPMRQNTQDSYGRSFTLPVRQNTQDSYNRSFTPPVRQNTADTFNQPLRQNTQDSFNRPTNPPMRQNTQDSFAQPVQRQMTQTSFHRPFSPPVRTGTGLSTTSRHTPAPEPQSYEMMPQSSSPPKAGGYIAFNPALHSASPVPAPALNLPSQPKRVVTSPMEVRAPVNDYFTPAMPVQRSVTAPPEQGAYDDLLDDYGDDGAQHDVPGRSATAVPGQYQHHGGRW